MMIVNLQCPGCGARVQSDQKTCIYCAQPIIISSFNDAKGLAMPMLNKYKMCYQKAISENPDNVDINLSLTLCLIALKVYDKALDLAMKAVDIDCFNANAYFYASICVLGGKKPFLCSREVINKAEEYLNACISLDPQPIHYALWAYIKQDYFARKSFMTQPNYKDLVNLALSSGLSQDDYNSLCSILGIEQIQAFI